MAQIANIVINDGKPTPVAHTFSPSRVDGSEAEWHDRAVGYPVGYSRLIVGVDTPKGNGPFRVRVSLKIPTLETVAGPSSGGFQPGPTLAYEEVVACNFTFSQRTSEQDREDLRVMLIAALGNAQIVEAIEKLAPVY